MFKKELFSLMFCWSIVVLGCLTLLYLSPSDAEISYQRLMNYSDQARKDRLQDNAEPAQQFRQEVSKQILYKKGGERLEVYLRGDESELRYSKKDRELTERFKGLDCIMQDEFVRRIDEEIPNDQSQKITEQIIRGLKAQEAVYSYQRGILEAQEMVVAHYILPGRECPHSLKGFQPLFEGKAYRSQIALFKEPNMQAQGFQAIFHELESAW